MSLTLIISRLRALRNIRLDVRWVVVGITIVVGLVLGWIGLEQLAEQNREDNPEAGEVSNLDILYDDLRLLVFGGVPGPVPWQLDIARFLLPGAAGYSAYAAIVALYHERIKALRARTLHGHTIVAGLGGKGLPLVLSLRAAGTTVVAIELDPSSPGIAPAREADAVVILGDASDGPTLNHAGARRAAYLVAAADDAANAEIALRALEVERASGPPLRSVVYVIDPDLAQLLQRDALAGADEGPTQIEFVNLHDQAAQLLLRDYLDDGAAVAVVGTGLTAERLVVRAGHDAATSDTASRPVVLAGDDAPALAARLGTRHDWLGEHVRVIECPVEAAGRLAAQLFESGPVTVFVCLEDPNDALEVALSLREPARRSRSCVVVALSRPGGLADVIDRANQSDGDKALRAVSIPDLVCTADFVLVGLLEQMARAAHETWLEKHGGPQRPAGEPNVEWDALSESWREANREQVAHAGAKLEAIGCRIVLSNDPSGSGFAYADAEIEDLARLEHDRWVAAKLRDGWTYDAIRDDATRRHDKLVPWADLTEEDREKDRDPVRAVPVWLLRAGFDIERTSPSP